MFLKNYININIIFLLLYSKKKINVNNFDIVQNDFFKKNNLNVFSFINLQSFKLLLNFKLLKNYINVYLCFFLFFYKNNFLNNVFNFYKVNAKIKNFYMYSYKNLYVNNIKLEILQNNYFFFFNFFKNNVYVYNKQYLYTFSSFKIIKKNIIFNRNFYIILNDLLSYNIPNINYLCLNNYLYKNSNLINIYKNFNIINKNINDINIFYCDNKLAFFKKYFSTSNYSLDLFKHYALHYSLKQVSAFNNYAKSFFFFEIFLKKFFELKYKKFVYMNIKKNNISYLSNNIYYLSLLRRLKKLQIFSKQANLIKEIVEILMLTFFTHDIILFKNWLINVCEKLHFKAHKKLFYILKVIIIKYFNLYFKYFGCLGFCLKINGKIGLGGSSKTKNFWIKVGKFSLSRKNLKIGYTAGSIRTYSGILGVEFILSYI